MRQNVLEVTITARVDIGNEMCIMHASMLTRAPSLRGGASCTAQALPSRIIQPGFKHKKRGPQISCPNFSKSWYSTRSTIFFNWQRYTLYGQNNSDESGI
jgi:hypothetical protein